MPRLLYSLALYLLLPFTPLRLWWRGIRQPEYRWHWAERYGFYRGAVPPAIIWLHCVSLGETHAAAPLIHQLQQWHGYRILLTHATPTGRAASERLFGDGVDRVYLPYDTPDAVARFLDHFKPRIGLLLETELWFNLIAGCAARNIPILLVNARLSERSARGYAKVARLTRQGLQRLTVVAAQTEPDAERLRQLGAVDVNVCGNLKFDVRPPVLAAAQGVVLRAMLGQTRPVFLAASTRDGEEVLLLDMLENLPLNSRMAGLLTVIVPRHPQRFEAVAELLTRRGISFVRKSTLVDGSVLDSTVRVVLGDTMGEMFVYYAACDVAFVGGSLLPLGGQNLLEACTMGKPVLIGPHTFNFAQIAQQAVSERAARRVRDGAALSQALQQLLTDQDLYADMSGAALAFGRSAGGASERIAGLVRQTLREG